MDTRGTVLLNEPTWWAPARQRLEDILATDPRRREGETHPLAVQEARRVVHWLNRLAPDASWPLQFSAWGHHVERWISPRTDYPLGRAGYLRWRENLKQHHANKLEEILKEAGADGETIGRVKALVHRRALSGDPDGQLLEDAICLAFLEDELAPFKPKVSDDKMREILQKTWRKMGPRGRALAGEVPLSPDLKNFVLSAVNPE